MSGSGMHSNTPCTAPPRLSLGAQGAVRGPSTFPPRERVQTEISWKGICRLVMHCGGSTLGTVAIVPHQLAKHSKIYSTSLHRAKLGIRALITHTIGPSRSLGLKVALEELGDFVLLREELANLWVARVRQSRGNGS